jgi:D-proline reductase (dithiol) PrdB
LALRQKKDKFIANLLTKYPRLLDKWIQKSEFIEFNDSPWTQLEREVNQCRVTLITSGGVHLKSQTPFNMTDPAGDPTFREIPANISPSDLTITHNYYDHSDADKDINIILPLERIQDLKQSDDIGDVNHRHFSFMGHIMHHHIDTLMKDTAPNVAAKLKSDKVDIAILTPA